MEDSKIHTSIEIRHSFQNGPTRHPPSTTLGYSWALSRDWVGRRIHRNRRSNPRSGGIIVVHRGHMETNPNPDLELVHVAIQTLLEDNKKEEERRKRQPQASGDSVFFGHEVDDGDTAAADHLLLSKLLSQVESLKASRAIKKPEASADTGVAVNKVEAVGLEAEEDNRGGETEATPAEIVRELKKVKRQNTVTHCLLSALMVLTLGWQLSEVSLILKVREGLNHPFRSFGSVITEFFKGPATKGGPDNADRDADQRQSETMGIPPLKMPELPHFDVPGLIPNGGNHSPGSV